MERKDSKGMRKNRSKKLRLEALERRLMLNGDVTVRVNSLGDLSILGDGTATASS